jgi:hypothetical protein
MCMLIELIETSTLDLCYVVYWVTMLNREEGGAKEVVDGECSNIHSYLQKFPVGISAIT